MSAEAADLVRALARDAAQRGLSLQDALGLFEAGVIGAHLAVARGNRTLAAATLGYERSHLLRRLRGLGITRSDDE